MNKFLFL